MLIPPYTPSQKKPPPSMKGELPSSPLAVAERRQKTPPPPPSHPTLPPKPSKHVLETLMKERAKKVREMVDSIEMNNNHKESNNTVMSVFKPVVSKTKETEEEKSAASPDAKANVTSVEVEWARTSPQQQETKKESQLGNRQANLLKCIRTNVITVKGGKEGGEAKSSPPEKKY